MKKALILLNMGSPRDLDEVPVFLKNMFNDPNIITVKSNLLRSFIAFMIVTTRKKSAQGHYAEIGGKSPLLGHTLALIEKLKPKLPNFDIFYSFRYTPLFSHEVIKELKEKKYEDVWLLPLYPQYSTTTTKSSLEDFLETSKKMGFTPNFHVKDRFYEDENYNRACVMRIKEVIAGKDAKEYTLIFSVHSLPQKIIDAGDPYKAEIEAHANILKNMLENDGVHFKETLMGYQSKLGPMKWIEPSLEDTLKSVKDKKVVIFPISFVSDNVETDFELSIEYKEVADELGFESYIVAKCPNDSSAMVDCVVGIIHSA